MKFRTDFVTNSSSSSFVVSFGADKEVGDAGFEIEEFYGDYTGGTLGYYERDEKAQHSVKIEINTEYELAEAGLLEDPEDTPDYLMDQVGFAIAAGSINLSDWIGMDPEQRAQAIADTMGTVTNAAGDKFESDEEDDEDEYYEDDDADPEVVELYEQMKERLIKAKETCKNTMLNAWKEKIPNHTYVKMTISGWGEMTPDAEDVLTHIFGYYAKHIVDVCKSRSVDEAYDMLTKESNPVFHARNSFKNVEPESIKKLIQFVQDFDYTEQELTVTQSISKNGLVEYEFKYE